MSKQPSRSYLLRLLSERNQFPDRVAHIDELIRKTFERRVAILALDMCGFSRLTAQHGIIHYLAMIHQMEDAARPAVTGNGGQVIKQEADNLFAIFDAPASALEAALDIFRAFEAINTVVPPERDIYGSIGIGYGETLVIGEEDLFGSEMNLASKLGEDLAEPNEILLTAAAYAALPGGFYRCEPADFSLSGIELRCRRFVEKIEPEQTTVR
ncbi:MAG TPA: adenylate/guanylate cyclase domain-containing protein [Blastocatellia bacterium]|nr:adenylate/guanylate cyclase domain-containing protein [Blastocatellia bacterium]